MVYIRPGGNCTGIANFFFDKVSHLKHPNLYCSRGGPCFIFEEHLVEDLVLGGKQALVGRDLHAAHKEGEVLGQARVGQEEVGEISCHIPVLL